MARTLQQILIDVNSSIDLDASLPSGTELTTRTNYADQAVWDATAIGQFSEFKREFISTATMATVSLPADFREPQENPRLLDSTGNWQEYEIIEAEQKYQYVSTNRYAYIMGDPAGGYNLIMNNLITNGTLSFIYQRFPSGFATLTDVCELSDPQYVSRKIESYVLYSRSDERFPIAEEKAQQTLANMLGREAKGTVAGGKSTKMTFSNPLKNLA